MKKAQLTACFGLWLACGLGAGQVQAGGPSPWGPMPVSGTQPQPNGWEFRPPREPRVSNMNPGAPPAQSYQYNYSYQKGRPGPKISFGQPPRQAYGQPRGQGFGPGPGQGYGPPRGQGFGPGRGYGQPGSQGFPGRPQGYRPGYQGQQGAGQAPRIETSLSKERPYNQETTIYTLRVVSDRNIQTIDVDLPNSSDVVFQKLEGPKARLRKRRGKQEIVNEFHYSLTPLRDGYLQLPPVRVKGTMAPDQSGYPGQAQPFEISAAEGIRLNVRPMDPSVQPWLPLQQLTLRAGMEGQTEIEAGKPLSLWIEIAAVGAMASELPSIESQLKSEDFRVYREKTQSRNEISTDGRYLKGVRTEYYTLVPQYGGELRLPPVRLAWWDVNAATKQYASLPIKSLRAGGDAPGDGLFGGLIPATTFFPGGSPSVFWIPLTGIFGLLLGYWLAVWLRARSGGEQRRPSLPLIPGLGRLRGPAAAAAGWVSPALGRFRPYTRRVSHAVGNFRARIRDKLVYALPRSLRFWYAMRCVEQETDPTEWSRALTREASRHLDMAPQSPLPDIGDRIVQLQPKGNAEQMQTLMRELDGAVYGGEAIDFEQWKRDFRKQVRLGLLPGRRRSGTRPRIHLPALNPRAA